MSVLSCRMYQQTGVLKRPLRFDLIYSHKLSENSAAVFPHRVLTSIDSAQMASTMMQPQICRCEIATSDLLAAGLQVR